MSVHIITHCYAVKLPQYAAFLRYQLSSLVLYPPSVPVKITVCYSVADHRVVSVLGRFLEEASELKLYCHAMPEPELFRRCIGRNAVGRKSDADAVWFTDVDYLFRYDCLDRLMDVCHETDDSVTLLYPRTVQVQREHHLGDELVAGAARAGQLLLDVDPSQFVPKRERKAIGGIQIARGSFVRQHGYLSGHRLQAPADRPFESFADDVAFRADCAKHGEVRGMELPGLFRLRHTRTSYQ